jgi:hypothetical protein
MSIWDCDWRLTDGLICYASIANRKRWSGGKSKPPAVPETWNCGRLTENG